MAAKLIENIKRYLGTIAEEAALSTTGLPVGSTFQITDTGSERLDVWTGTAWALSSGGGGTVGLEVGGSDLADANPLPVKFTDSNVMQPSETQSTWWDLVAHSVANINNGATWSPTVIDFFAIGTNARCTKLIGMINCNANLTMTIFYGAIDNATFDSVASKTISITGGTPMEINETVKGRWVKVVVTNSSGGATTTFRGSLYASV